MCSQKLRIFRTPRKRRAIDVEEWRNERKLGGHSNHARVGGDNNRMVEERKRKKDKCVVINVFVILAMWLSDQLSPGRHRELQERPLHRNPYKKGISVTELTPRYTDLVGFTDESFDR